MKDQNNMKTLDELTMELLKIMDSENVYKNTLKITLDNQPTLKNVRSEVDQFVEKYLSYDEIKNDLAKIYKNHFTMEEIETFIKFYSTPTGQKFIKLQSTIVEEAQMISQSIIQKHMAELQQMIEKKFLKLKQLNKLKIIIKKE